MKALSSSSVRLIDFQNYAGCRIDRKLNKENGLKEANPFFVSLPNITVYMPSNPFKMTANFLGGSGPKGPKGAMQIDTLTLELIVAIKSNLKLDLIDRHPDKGQRQQFLTPSKRNDDEIHFVRFEGRLPALELSMATIKDQQALKKLTEIEDWTITDFDNCLNGNPHV